MNCTDIAALLPLYFSGSLDLERAAQFAAHLRSCPDCQREIDQQSHWDKLLRDSVLEESAHTGALEQRVRQRMAADRDSKRPLRWALTAAAIAILAVLAGIGVRLLLAPRPPALYADAARDHRDEVLQRQSRHWVSTTADVQALLVRQGIDGLQVGALAPERYRLDRAKLCRLDGRVFLHLVFADGRREFSVFLRKRDPEALPGTPTGMAAGLPLYSASLQRQTIAALQTSAVTALFAAGPEAESASNLARVAANSL